MMLPLVCLLIGADSASLHGRVWTAGTRQPIEGADIAVRGLGFSIDTRSAPDGTFHLLALPEGAAQVIVRHETHDERLTQVTLRGSTNVDVYLKPARARGFETVVFGKKDERDVERRTLSHEEILKVPGGYGDPLRATQNLPGVARPPFGLGLLVLRGADPADAAYVIDGMNLGALYHFGALASVIPEPLIDQVNLYPGTFSARYGRATSGIVEVQTRPAELGTWRVKASLDLAQASLFVQAPIGERTSLVIAARRSYLDATLPAILPLVVRDAPTLLPAYTDYQARLTHRTERVGEFSLLFYGSHDALKLAQEESKTTGTLSPTELRYTNTFNALQPKWTWEVSKNLTQTLTLVGARASVEANTPQSSYARGDWQVGGREEIALKLGRSSTLAVGIDGFGGTYDFSSLLPLEPPARAFPSPVSLFPPLTRTLTQGASYDVAIYSEANVRAQRFTLSPGVRLAFIGSLSTMLQSLQPRVSARFNLMPSVQLKAGVGWYEKEPGGQGLIPGISGNWSVLQSTLQSSLGAEWQPLPWLSAEVTGYYAYMWRQPARSSALVSADAALQTPRAASQDQEGRTFGVQAIIRAKPYRGFSGFIAYTLSRSERISSQVPYWHPFDYDQPHLLTASASYKLPLDFQIGLRFRVTSGNPYTPVSRAPFDADTGGYQPIRAAHNSGRLPVFHQLDVRIDKAFVFDAWSLSLYVDVQNVYNARNVEFYQFAYDYRQTTPLFGLPILPVIGVVITY
jgi:Carboxypeptidase regulatory-like domain/TonB-dependent Receptor Plug Domain